MAVHRVDPFQDPRWAELLERHPMASVFHTPGWLEVLRRSYGYESFVLTTTGPGKPLENGIVFSRVKSWIIGSRIVCLPFSDHCQPLVDRRTDLSELLEGLRNDPEARRWKYIELRPLEHLEPDIDAAFSESSSFCFHQLDLRPSIDDLFRNLHRKSCVQMLQRAERERLTVEEGRSELLLKKLYALLLCTRRRHHLPPQPFCWFSHLIESLGDKATIRVASKDGHPIASLLALRYKKTVVYKYAGSDEEFHHLGGTALLLWRTIQEGRHQGAEQLDLGRSELENTGLITFKDRWGAVRSRLTYYRYPRAASRQASAGWKLATARKLLGVLPDSCLTAIGRLLYRHVG